MLLNAFKQLQASVENVSLNINGGTSGDDSEKYLQELKNFASENNLNVSFSGWTDTEGVIDYLHNSDVFVLASENEGLPGVIIEAMAIGMPVVSTNAGGCADAVKDGLNGYIVPIGDENLLAEKMNDLVDKNKRKRFGENSFRFAHEKYSVAAFGERFMKIINEL